ncbi:MAG: hypothetical protein PF450_06550 [Bacteroidales bacterium]|jgi:hypothetical protein|nr:hypothetical protein [Bacteroidales bacterium]
MERGRSNYKKLHELAFRGGEAIERLTGEARTLEAENHDLKAKNRALAHELTEAKAVLDTLTFDPDRDSNKAFENQK